MPTGNATSDSGYLDQSSASNGQGGACAAVSAEAMPSVQPADIILAVDTSGSMKQKVAGARGERRPLS